MQSYFAEIGEIVRAQRRDDEELEILQERLSKIVKELAGQRIWLRVYPHLQLVSKVAYYSCTLLSGVQTLGEEYVHLFESATSSRGVPSWSSRFVFVFLHSFAPVLALYSIQKAEHTLRHPSTDSFLGIPLQNNDKARKSLISLVVWIRSAGIHQLRRLHLALFYIFGVYYSISRRVTGIRFLSLSPQTDIAALKVYRILGYLTLAQTTFSVLLFAAFALGEETRRAKSGKVKKAKGGRKSVEKAVSHPWFRCSVCLEGVNPSAVPCGHLFCWNCIQEHARTSNFELKCPQCRISRHLTSASQPQDLYFSGIQPTGVPHLGNYFGFIEPWLNLQKELPVNTGMILSVVDQHAISLGPKPANELRSDTRTMMAGLLACGVSPERTLLFRQSDVPQIAQLNWILGSLQTVTKLQRLPQYKEKSSKFPKGEVPVGLLTYPLLQAADVLMFRATHVPVGADQSQHMNLLTDLAYHFNKKFNENYFPLPKQLTREVSARVKSLRDPLKKMSKSDPSERSRISITESKASIEEKCRKAVSDSEPLVTYEPDRRPAVSNLVDLYCAVAGKVPPEIVEKEWNTMELKTRLAEVIEKKLAPIRQKAEQLQRGNEVDEIIFEGGKKAKRIAEDNMRQIRRVVGFS